MSIPAPRKYTAEIKEQWITFDPGGIYAVSSLGRIRNNQTGCIRRLFLDKDGYPKIKLYDRRGKRIGNRVNVLVATWHLRPPRPGEEVDHLDGNRSNNAAGNLRWVTHYQNIRAGMLRRERQAGQQFFEDVL